MLRKNIQLFLVLILFNTVEGQNHFPTAPKAPSFEDYMPKGTIPNKVQQEYIPNTNNINYQIEQHHRNETIRKSQLEELQKDLDEIKQRNAVYHSKTGAFSQAELQKIKTDKDLIFQTFDELKNILVNKTNTSLSDIFYLTENAWGNMYLSKKEYDETINSSIDFIQKWMKQNNLNPNNQEDIHFAIQNFMGKDLSITEMKKTKEGKYISKQFKHKSFFYDYKDYKAFEDHRNFFVTKCIATGSGQCKSLPLVYLIFAERLGAKAYLSTSPNHTFVKYTNNKGEIENYEPTSNWKLSDQWYQENFYITDRAIQTGLYLDTLTKQKIIGESLIDLGFFYIRKIPLNKENFLARLLTEVDKCYPKNNNDMTYHIYKSYLEGLLRIQVKTKNLKTQKDIENDPESNEIQQLLIINEMQLKELGYSRIPDDRYEQIMKEQEFKGKIQDSFQINGKQKRNQFSIK